jgi:hypothetical protein
MLLDRSAALFPAICSSLCPPHIQHPVLATANRSSQSRTGTPRHDLAEPVYHLHRHAARDGQKSLPGSNLSVPHNHEHGVLAAKTTSNQTSPAELGQSPILTHSNKTNPRPGPVLNAVLRCPSMKTIHLYTFIIAESTPKSNIREGKSISNCMYSSPSRSRNPLVHLCFKA